MRNLSVHVKTGLSWLAVFLMAFLVCSTAFPEAAITDAFLFASLIFAAAGSMQRLTAGSLIFGRDDVPYGAAALGLTLIAAHKWGLPFGREILFGESSYVWERTIAFFAVWAALLWVRSAIRMMLSPYHQNAAMFTSAGLTAAAALCVFVLWGAMTAHTAYPLLAAFVRDGSNSTLAKALTVVPMSIWIFVSVLPCWALAAHLAKVRSQTGLEESGRMRWVCSERTKNTLNFYIPAFILSSGLTAVWIYLTRSAVLPDILATFSDKTATLPIEHLKDGLLSMGWLAFLIIGLSFFVASMTDKPRTGAVIKLVLILSLLLTWIAVSAATLPALWRYTTQGPVTIRNSAVWLTCMIAWWWLGRALTAFIHSKLASR